MLLLYPLMPQQAVIDSLVCPLTSLAFMKFTFRDRIIYDDLYYDILTGL